MPAAYPTSVKAFTTKTNNTVADASHINDVQAEVTAIETDLLAGLPIARGGTGNTTIGAAGTVLTSDGALATWAPNGGADSESTVIAGTLFG